MYRYWTGSSWTEAITPNPQGTPAPQPPTPPQGTPPGYGGYPGGSTPGYGTGSAPGYRTGTSPGQGPGAGGYPTGTPAGGRRSTVVWWVVGLAALLAVVLVVVFIVRGMGSGGTVLPTFGGNPTSTASANVCPPASSDVPTPTSQDRPGWRVGGKLGYPALGSPWENGLDNRVPWGALAQEQEVLDQADYDGTGSGHNWVASVLVSDLFVGDGFASTKVAAETVLKCVLGVYYADTVVTQNPVSSARHDVDGHSGWLIETQLSFDIPGLRAKGERVLLLVVQTSDADYGLFYASVPDTSSSLLPDARKALAGVKVFS